MSTLVRWLIIAAIVASAVTIVSVTTEHCPRVGERGPAIGDRIPLRGCP